MKSWLYYLIVFGIVSLVLGSIVLHMNTGRSGKIKRAETVTVEGNYTIYVFGTDKCPHCQSLHSFLESSGYRYVYCDLDGRVCTNLFMEWLKLTGLRPVIPQSLVVVNGSLSAVVLGEVTLREFWNTLIQNSSKKGEVTVYVGSAKAGEISLEDIQGFLATIREKLGGPEG